LDGVSLVHITLKKSPVYVDDEHLVEEVSTRKEWAAVVEE